MRLNADFDGILIEDELHNVGPLEFALEHDTIMDDGFSIYTGINKTGGELIPGTDYELLHEDTRLSAQTDGKHIYTKVRILNENYHGTNLYITYKTVGDYAVADDINAAAEKVLTPQIKVDLTNPEMVPTWPFILNHTKNHVLEFPHDEARAVCCDDKYVYVCVRSFSRPPSIIKIDAYTKEPVLSVDTDQFYIYDPTYMVNLGNYLFVFISSGEIVKYDTETLTEVGRSQTHYDIVGLTADYNYLYCLTGENEPFNPNTLIIIDPATMREIQSIDLSEKVLGIEIHDNTSLIICGKDKLVFKCVVQPNWSVRLMWILRPWHPHPGVGTSDFSAASLDVYPTGTIFTQDDSFFSIDWSSNESTIELTIERVTRNEKTEMLTFSGDRLENIKATTDGKYVYFVGRRENPAALIVVKYDPVKNKVTKKTVQGALEPKAVTSNGRQLIILCTDNNSDPAKVKLLFLNTRMEEGVEP